MKNVFVLSLNYSQVFRIPGKIKYCTLPAACQKSPEKGKILNYVH